jgi:hypothetical protein
MNRPANGDREVISELTTGRLSVYLRCLTFLESQGQKTVSSHEMAERFHLNSAQIRKDLACFGEFGTRGVGYDVSRLKANLTETLGIDRTRNVLIVGAGNLGMALADYEGFNSNGFHLVAIVDSDPRRSPATSVLQRSACVGSGAGGSDAVSVPPATPETWWLGGRSVVIASTIERRSPAAHRQSSQP